MLRFDHDSPGVFAETVDWIEANRLECATFHVLTPYPGTPLFRQLEAEVRRLHKDWSKYNAAHVVFQPKHMTPDDLAHGYAWCYQRLFSLKSIWRRGPDDPAAVLPYLAMSLLYKRSDWLWHFLSATTSPARSGGRSCGGAGGVTCGSATAPPAAARTQASAPASFRPGSDVRSPLPVLRGRVRARALSNGG